MTSGDGRPLLTVVCLVRQAGRTFTATRGDHWTPARQVLNAAGQQLRFANERAVRLAWADLEPGLAKILIYSTQDVQETRASGDRDPDRSHRSPYRRNAHDLREVTMTSLDDALVAYIWKPGSSIPGKHPGAIAGSAATGEVEAVIAEWMLSVLTPMQRISCRGRTGRPARSRPLIRISVTPAPAHCGTSSVGRGARAGGPQRTDTLPERAILARRLAGPPCLTAVEN